MSEQVESGRRAGKTFQQFQCFIAAIKKDPNGIYIGDEYVVMSKEQYLKVRAETVAPPPTRESGEAASPFRCENCGRTIEEGENYTVWSDGIRTHNRCQRGSATKPKEKRE